MGYLLYIAIVGIQLLSIFAEGTLQSGVPLNCFLQKENFFNIFKESDCTSRKDNANPIDLDTIKIDKISLILDGWSYNTTDLKYLGLNEAVIDDFGFNFGANSAHITFHTDMLVTCNYKANGLLFSLPIYGDGSCYVYLYNVQIGLIMPFDVLEESDQQFINLRSFQSFYDVQDSANITLTNLYKGDKNASDRMHHLMNRHWKYVTERYSAIFMDAAAENFFDMLKNHMLDMPLKGRNHC